MAYAKDDPQGTRKWDRDTGYSHCNFPNQPFSSSTVWSKPLRTAFCHIPEKKKDIGQAGVPPCAAPGLSMWYNDTSPSGLTPTEESRKTRGPTLQPCGITNVKDVDVARQLTSFKALFPLTLTA
jgi:hypothetical protein